MGDHRIYAITVGSGTKIHLAYAGGSTFCGAGAWHNSYRRGCIAEGASYPEIKAALVAKGIKPELLCSKCFNIDKYREAFEAARS